MTGPTGRGKSSTVYTSLNWVKPPTKNIITVETTVSRLLDLGVEPFFVASALNGVLAQGLLAVMAKSAP